MTPPICSVVIPVGPGHAHYLPSALASVQAQTFTDWECIVVNDTGKPFDEAIYLQWTSLTGARKIAWQGTGGSKGSGYARNHGTRYADAPWTVFLDADDVLMPKALEHLLRTAAEQPEAAYVYGDWYTTWEGLQEPKYQPAREYADVLRYNPHVVTALYQTEVLRDLDGFDETLQGYEDWELVIKLRANGHCGARVPAPIIVYRVQAGQRRNWSMDKANEPGLIAAIRDERYGAYVRGEKEFAMCCGQRPVAQQAARLAATALLPQETILEDGMVRMRYIGDNVGSISFHNPDNLTGRYYQGGANAHNRYADVEPHDVKFLEGTGAWKTTAPIKADKAPQVEAVILPGSDVDATPTVEEVVTFPAAFPDDPEPRVKRGRKAE